jgi:menaquinone-dependent protoporphyrinogen oxidase
MGTMAVLVAYATRNGSTREVAAVIAGTFRALGVNVELGEARYVRGQTDHAHGQGRSWNLVLLGAPLYSGRWHRDAHRFLRQHRTELAGVPVAVFGMGPRRADAEAWQRSRQQLDRALAKHGWLTPIAVTVFGGVDPPGKQPRRDLRNWTQIEAWAAGIVTPAAWLPGDDRVTPVSSAAQESGESFMPL